jgi:hypothetical protein
MLSHFYNMEVFQDLQVVIGLFVSYYLSDEYSISDHSTQDWHVGAQN